MAGTMLAKLYTTQPSIKIYIHMKFKEVVKNACPHPGPLPQEREKQGVSWKNQTQACTGAILSTGFVLLCLASCVTSTVKQRTQKSAASQMAQVPTWSRQDLDFFLH